MAPFLPSLLRALLLATCCPLATGLLWSEATSGSSYPVYLDRGTNAACKPFTVAGKEAQMCAFNDTESAAIGKCQAMDGCSAVVDPLGDGRFWIPYGVAPRRRTYHSERVRGLFDGPWQSVTPTIAPSVITSAASVQGWCKGVTAFPPMMPAGLVINGTECAAMPHASAFGGTMCAWDRNLVSVAAAKARCETISLCGGFVQDGSRFLPYLASSDGWFARTYVFDSSQVVPFGPLAYERCAAGSSAPSGRRLQTTPAGAIAISSAPLMVQAALFDRVDHRGPWLWAGVGGMFVLCGAYCCLSRLCRRSKSKKSSTATATDVVTVALPPRSTDPEAPSFGPESAL